MSTFTDADARPTAPDPDRYARPLGFGAVFTPHMVLLEWDAARGWHSGRVSPYGPLPLDPAASVLHYGQAVFEGLKAYRQPHGGVALFRPYENARRFNRSAQRLAMPAVPEEVFVEALEVLVGVDHAWVPDGVGRTLYLRPFMVATEPTFGVRPAERYLFCVLASPVDGFFAGALRPIRAWLSDGYVRAAPGGTGEAKFAGNYAASMLAQRQAAEQGCDQVVFLDAGGQGLVEEMGAMNVVLVEAAGGRPRLVTPPLTGTLLAGVTRDSLLLLAHSLGYAVEQRPLTVGQWHRGSLDGTYPEAFACGTAACVTPIGEVRSTTDRWLVGDGTPGPVTMRLREELLGIQYGTGPDLFGWLHKLP